MIRVIGATALALVVATQAYAAQPERGNGPPFSSPREKAQAPPLASNAKDAEEAAVLALVRQDASLAGVELSGDVIVLTNGELANVRAPYRTAARECGVRTVDLAKADAGWQVVRVADAGDVCADAE